MAENSKGKRRRRRALERSTATRPPHADKVASHDTPQTDAPKPEKDVTFLTNADPPPRNKHETCYCKPDHTPIWKMVAEIGAIIIGFSVALIYYGQLTQMIESNRISREALESVQRAWVGPDLTGDEIPIVLGGAGSRISWNIYFRNFGMSPARRIKWHTRLFTAPKEVDWQSVQSEVDALDFTVQQEHALFNGSRGLNSGYSEILMTPELQDAIDARTVRIILGGKVSYWDVFGKVHQTTLCIVYVPKLGNTLEGYFDCPIETKTT